MAAIPPSARLTRHTSDTARVSGARSLRSCSRRIEAAAAARRQGIPAAEAAAWLGHSPHVHLATYVHATLVDRDELNYPSLRVSAPMTIVPPVWG
jgi:hypothetical protein